MRYILFLAAILIGAPVAAQTPPSPAAILRSVDALRSPNEPHLVQRITLQSRSARGADAPGRYEVRTRRGSGSLVLALGGDGRGQKYLSTPNGFWFYAPRTRQAIRMTPAQLLRGQASVGDISRVSLSEDYAATVRPERDRRIGEARVWTLDLTARSQLATYPRMTLFVEQGTNRPVQADLFVASGRQLKTIRFGAVETVSGRRIIRSITYVDGLDPSRSTTQTIDSIEAVQTPATHFRPQALPLDL